MRLRRTGRVPSDARVRHYDELDERTQAVVPELADRPRTALESADLEDGDVVKFTDCSLIRTR
ncbi:hypothetical protein [Halorubrum cibi]|uniref:DUF7979 domain-containing protein n=1 Tax=Halorubrum cibi TaxID=413815 RepID=A0A521B732_9EURY|nr:hypothetical protein [Halorubrum cibi]SMO42893.1 hypothetical protein SAMN06264867_10263 [Halorubrum cibi]